MFAQPIRAQETILNQSKGNRKPSRFILLILQLLCFHQTGVAHALYIARLCLYHQMVHYGRTVFCKS